MKNKWIAWLLVIFFSFSLAFGQRFGPGRMGGFSGGGFGLFPNRGPGHFGFFGGGPFSFIPRHHFGSFFFSHPFAGHRSPLLVDPDGFGHGRFSGRFGRHSLVGTPLHPAFSFGGFGYNTVVGTTTGGWDRFVETWGDRDPRTPERTDPSENLIASSILLREGMSEEEVVMSLGTPIQRIKLGGKEIWKYSGYSIVMESGLLREIR